jgi:hypothetical protein
VHSDDVGHGGRGHVDADGDHLPTGADVSVNISPVGSPGPSRALSRPATAKSRASRPASALTEATFGTGADVDIGLSVHSDDGDHEAGDDTGTLPTGADVSVNVSPTGTPAALQSRPATATGGRARARRPLSAAGSDRSVGTGMTVDVGLSVHSEGEEDGGAGAGDDGASLGTGEDVSVALSADGHHGHGHSHSHSHGNGHGTGRSHGTGQVQVQVHGNGQKQEDKQGLGDGQKQEDKQGHVHGHDEGYGQGHAHADALAFLVGPGVAVDAPVTAVRGFLQAHAVPTEVFAPRKQRDLRGKRFVLNVDSWTAASAYRAYLRDRGTR